MPSVKDVLRSKGRSLWSIGPSHTVYQAIEMMAVREIGALTVIDDQGKLAGIISERDYARKIILQGRSSSKTNVSEIMTRKVITTHADMPVEACMELMTNHRVRHLPVVDGNDSPEGMISVGDLVKVIITEKDFQIEQLERYVRG